MKEKQKKPVLSFSQKLFLAMMLLFMAFAGTFLIYQFQREKLYKTSLLNTTLQHINKHLHSKSKTTLHNDSLLKAILSDDYLCQYQADSLRVTIVGVDGMVIFDNKHPNVARMDNHLQRTEIQQALQTGSGYDIRRTSESTGIDYFYSAQYYPAEQYVIRSALPYNTTLVNHLKADYHFIGFTIIATLLLSVFFYQYTRQLNKSFTRLRHFTQQAGKSQPIETELQDKFPNNELGEISQHIIQIYRKLHHTKDALYIEREKLIAHLQISREGLGIFKSNQKEILVNSLFTQYSNLISDNNLLSTEDFFAIPEIQPITDFINSQKPTGTGEKRKTLNIQKNGKSFTVECFIFQDSSFEISINDATQEQNQAELKRQLTQNAAHELKTPISSIQAYLETIVNNKDLSEEKKNDFLQRCYIQSYRLSRLLRDISVLTRMDEAANMIDMEWLNVAVIMNTIQKEVSLEMEEKKIQFVNQLGSEVKIHGNSSLIYSIFRNLTDNAIAYAGTDITITVKCFREDDNFFYFSFADNGVGVPTEHLNRLFERFYRIDKGRSRKLGGTGLGLAIVKNAVLIHGGNISAKNNRGGGLEFVFTVGK